MSGAYTLENLIQKGRPLITDGAWGTQLQKMGLAANELPDLWNLSRPEKVGAVASAYVNAGADIVITNTFSANRIRLAESGAADQVDSVNEAGARLSSEAAGDRAVVFASMGPSGKFLLTGDVTVKELETAFTEQAKALARGGADGIVIETMSDLEEARIAVRSAKITGLPVIASMVFDSGPQSDRTMMGITPEQAASGLIEAGADAIGANCGQGIEGFVPICKRLHNESAGRPIWIKANAGLPEMQDGQTRYSQTPDSFAEWFIPLVEAGATFIGGCCGTTPEFILALRRHLDN